MEFTQRVRKNRTGARGAAVLVAVACGMAGCTAYTKNAQSTIEKSARTRFSVAGQLGAEEVERMNRAFADRYVMRISTACDLITEGNKDEAQCRMVRDLRIGVASAMYDIVTDPDPYMQTLNLTMVVSLHYMSWVEEDRSHKIFGERGDAVATAIKGAHEDVRAVGKRVFTSAEMTTL